MMFTRKILSGEEVMLEIQGPLTGDTTREFQGHLVELAAGSWPRITLNLVAVPTINSPSIGKIMLFRKNLAEAGRVLQIRGCSEQLYKSLQMLRIDSLMPVDRVPPGA
jgi:anti-anti-sigma regulatory factor